MLMEQRQLKKPTPSGMAIPKSSGNSGIPGLASELMAAAPRFHKLHLKVTRQGSFAAHMALNTLYSDLPGHADDIVEQYQGVTETLIDIPEAPARPELKTVADALDYLREMYDRIDMIQASCKYSEINNSLDEIKSLINSSKYKLLFLS